MRRRRFLAVALAASGAGAGCLGREIRPKLDNTSVENEPELPGKLSLSATVRNIRDEPVSNATVVFVFYDGDTAVDRWALEVPTLASREAVTVERAAYVPEYDRHEVELVLEEDT